MITAIPIRRNRKRAGPFVLLALVLCVLVACAAGGCKDEPPSPRQVTKKVVSAPEQVPVPPEPKATEPAGSEPAETLPLEPPEEKQEVSVYRPKSDRDPFKSFVSTRMETVARTQKTPRIKTPLQRYSLDQLKVVGIIDGGRLSKALLEDDVGKGYVVSAGEAVGSEGGKITSIQKDRIIIESTYRDVLGKEKVRRITKKLYVSEEGENP